MNKIVWYCAVAAFFYSCGNGESASDDDVEGVYVREYSSEILNQLSGEKVGMRTVRDTVFINKHDGRYKVENSKWRMNDYDNDGWQNMEHGESRPFPSFSAAYDKSSRTLIPESGMAPDLVIAKDGKLSVGNKSEIAYSRIE